MSDAILEDDRVKWLRQKVVLALEITPESFDDHFVDDEEKNGAAELARQQITDYLSSKSGAGSALFFSAHNWAEDIEGKCLHEFSGWMSKSHVHFNLLAPFFFDLLLSGGNG